MNKQSVRKQSGWIQFIKFGMVGISNTAVNYGIYLLSLGALESVRGARRFDYLIAQMIAFVLSVLWSFFWNYKYVFTDQAKRGKADWKTAGRQLLRAYASYSFTGIFLNSFLLLVEVDALGMSKAVAPLVNLCISVPVNFWLNKYWTFGGKALKS